MAETARQYWRSHKKFRHTRQSVKSGPSFSGSDALELNVLGIDDPTLAKFSKTAIFAATSQ
jgi:hypothetical protein